MKNSKPGRPTIVISVFLALCITSGICAAQEADRKGKFEFHGILRSSGDIKATDRSEDSKYKVIGGLTGGLGIGYNINDFLNINGDFLFGSADGEITNLSGSLFSQADPDISIWDINLDYNIIKNNLTPVLTTGFGTIRYDSTIDLTGEDIGGRSNIYNIGGGFRWDISEDILLKLIYRRIWEEFEDADGTSKSYNVTLSLGFKF